MSLPRKTTINCSQCGKPYETTVFQSVNTGYAKDIAKQIIRGELFEAQCPHCGFLAHLEYDILYNDMNHGAMIWVVHDNTPDFESRVAEVRSTNIIEFKTTRIVTDINALREKVSCLERGRDDRIIELCKVFVTYNLISDHPDFDFRNAFYTFDCGQEFIFMYDMDGKSYGCELSDDIYNHWHDRYFSSECSNEFDGNYPIVDYAWAQPMLGLLLDLDSDDYDSDTKEKTESEIPTMHNEVLTCPNCKNQLPQDSEFCQYCGSKVTRLRVLELDDKKDSAAKAQQLQIHPKLSENEITINSSEAKQKRKKILLPILISLCVLVVIAAIAIPLGISENKYQQACLKLENGSYKEAIEMFENLEGYRNSEGKIQEAKDNYYGELYNDLSEKMLAIEYYHFDLRNSEIKDLINSLPSDYKDVAEIEQQRKQIEKQVKVIRSTTLRSDKDSEKIREAYAILYNFNAQHHNWDISEYLSEVLVVSFGKFVFGKKWENTNYFFQWYEDGDGDGERLWTTLPSNEDPNKDYYFYVSYEDGSGLLNPHQFGYENINNSADKFLAYRIVDISYTGGKWKIKIYCYSNNITYSLQ